MKESSLFIRACRKIHDAQLPVWLMRQAGRFMPEYLNLRKKYSFLEICRTPDLVTQVTLQPIHRFQFDAAILFSDILILSEKMGLRVNFVDGEGPKFDSLLRTQNDIYNLRIPGFPEEFSFIGDSIRLIQNELDENIPLIGFAGAPFTLACYMTEGKPSNNFSQVKKLMYSNPALMHQLMETL